jgi:mannosyltransferase
MTQQKLGPLIHLLWHHELPNALHLTFLRPLTYLFGTSEVALRAPSVLFAVATIPLAFRIARRFLSIEMSAIAVLFVALNGFFLTYAQQGRSYALAVLLTTAALLAALRTLEDPTVVRAGVWALAAAAATYAHFYAGFMFVGALLAFVVASSKSRSAIGLAALAAAAYGALIAPILAYLLVSDTIRAHLSQPDIHDLAAIVAGVSGDGGPLLTVVATGLTISGGIIVLRRFLAGDAGVIAASGLALFASLLAPGILALLYGALITPDIDRKYFTVCIVPMMIAAAIGVDSFGRRLRASMALVMVALLAWSVHQAYARPKDDFRGAVAFIARSARPGDGIAFGTWYSRTSAKYYLQRYAFADELMPMRPPLPLSELTWDIRDFREVAPASAAHRVWVVCAPAVEPNCSPFRFARIGFPPTAHGALMATFERGGVAVALEVAHP